MRSVMNLLVWLTLVGGCLATAQWARQEPDVPEGITINGQPLRAAPGQAARHDPRTCRSCNIGTRPQSATH